MFNLNEILPRCLAYCHHYSGPRPRWRTSTWDDLECGAFSNLLKEIAQEIWILFLAILFPLKEYRDLFCGSRLMSLHYAYVLRHIQNSWLHPSNYQQYSAKNLTLLEDPSLRSNFVNSPRFPNSSPLQESYTIQLQIWKCRASFIEIDFQNLQSGSYITLVHCAEFRDLHHFDFRLLQLDVQIIIPHKYILNINYITKYKRCIFILINDLLTPHIRLTLSALLQVKSRTDSHSE